MDELSQQTSCSMMRKLLLQLKSMCCHTHHHWHIVIHGSGPLKFMGSSFTPWRKQVVLYSICHYNVSSSTPIEMNVSGSLPILNY